MNWSAPLRGKLPEGWVRDSLTWADQRFGQLISATGGSGPSSARAMYVAGCAAGISCGVALILGGVWVYLGEAHHADGVYWSAATAYWVNLMAFIAATKMRQATHTKELAQSRKPDEPPPTP